MPIHMGKRPQFWAFGPLGRVLELILAPDYQSLSENILGKGLMGRWLAFTLPESSRIWDEIDLKGEKTPKIPI